VVGAQRAASGGGSRRIVLSRPALRMGMGRPGQSEDSSGTSQASCAQSISCLPHRAALERRFRPLQRVRPLHDCAGQCP